MAKDHRIDQSGQRLNFTCSNSRFQTDVAKGKPHGDGLAKGSVFDGPLVSHDESDPL